MRVLMVSNPGVGHVFPMVPLAWALRSAGHDVLVATCGEALAVADAGLQVVDVAPGLDMPALLHRISGTHPEVGRMLRSRLTSLREANKLFVHVSKHLVGGVVEVADAWRPDLVVHSQFNSVGLLVAARLGLPAVEHGFGIARTSGLHDLLRHDLADEFARYGAGGLPERRVTLDVAPPSLVAVAGGDARDRVEEAEWAMRYVPYNGGGVLPDWLARPSGQPRIAVTLGTITPIMRGLGAVERIIALASNVDAEFVLALGDADTSVLGPLPSTVRAVGWVPLSTLLPGCAAVVHHGGSGSTLTAAHAGVPQLLLADGADQHINAAALAARGNGLVGTADGLDADMLRRLLSDERLHEAAAEVGAEMKTLPAPAALLPRLAELAAGARVRTTAAR